MSAMNIQPGHIARHTPRNAGAQGREAAVIDIAQDLLLANLHERGVLDAAAIKGGTAIRKLYAGKEGRFSLDLDFAVCGIDDDRDIVAMEFAGAVDGLSIRPFAYGIEERRGKYSVTMKSKFVSEASLSTKLDFAPAPWLKPMQRSWVAMPIHAQYGFELPQINTVRLEENLAEKIARLNRTTTARDMYDLAWVAGTPAISQSLDWALIRRLAVLKVWVDTNGMHAGRSYWQPAHRGSAFDSERWLRKRGEDEFDLEDIGALAVPTPTAAALSKAVGIGYSFLADLDSDELVAARSDERDRSLVIRMLKDLSDGRLGDAGLY